MWNRTYGMVEQRTKKKEERRRKKKKERKKEERRKNNKKNIPSYMVLFVPTLIVLGKGKGCRFSNGTWTKFVTTHQIMGIKSGNNVQNLPFWFTFSGITFHGDGSFFKFYNIRYNKIIQNIKSFPFSKSHPLKNYDPNTILHSFQLKTPIISLISNHPKTGPCVQYGSGTFLRKLRGPAHKSGKHKTPNTNNIINFKSWPMCPRWVGRARGPTYSSSYSTVYKSGKHKNLFGLHERSGPLLPSGLSIM